MASRKPVSSLSPVPGRVPKSPIISAEYMEAIHILNENTLNQACDWLLDDTFMEADKLLETYHKCENALKVIQKQQPTPSSPGALPPGAPNLNAPSMRAPQHRGSLPKLAIKKSIAKGGVMPMRRTVMTKPGGRITRERSDSDVDLGPNKKARVSPPLPQQAPPPSALNFLAKLNKDKTNSNKESPKAPPGAQRKNQSRSTPRKTSS
jgi:hypothetical protein